MSEYIVFVSKEHYNPLGIVRTLGEAGISPIVVAVKGDLQFVGESKYVKEAYHVDTPEDGLELIISKFAKDKEDKSFILTGDDVTVALMDRNYSRLKDFFYFYNAGEDGRINYFMDKDVMIDLAIRHGLNVAKTWKVKVGEIPEDIEYPVMTKAINSIGKEWKSIVYVCHNDEELKDAFSKMESEEVLLQRYVHKVDEISFDAISVNKGTDVFFVMEANQEYNLPNTYSPYWDIHNSKNAEIQEKIREIAKEIRLEGIFELEFIKDDEDKLWFLEINFRNTCIGYATTVAGMPQVTIWCDSMKRGFIDKNCYKEIPEGLKAMAECWDYDARVKTGMISRKDWFKQYEAAQCKFYKGKDDDVPFSIFMHYKLDNMM